MKFSQKFKKSFGLQFDRKTGQRHPNSNTPVIASPHLDINYKKYHRDPNSDKPIIYDKNFKQKVKI